MIWKRRDETISEETLGAYLDGELDDARRMEVEACLAEDAAAAEYLENAASQKRALHRLFDPYLREPLPPEQLALAKLLESQIESGGRARNRRRLVAACVACLLLAGGAVIGWQQIPSATNGDRLFALFQEQPSSEQPQVASGQAPIEPEQAVAIMGGEGEDASESGAGHRGDRDQARAPDLTKFGFDLVATRLLARQENRSMHLVYESDQGARIQLFFSPQGARSKTSLTLMEEGPVSALFWSYGGHAYTLIGEIERDTLLEIGQVVNGEWSVEISSGAGGSSAEEDQNRKSASEDDEGASGSSSSVSDGNERKNEEDKQEKPDEEVAADEQTET